MRAFWKQAWKTKTEGFFWSHDIHSWIRALSMKEHPSQGFMYPWFPPQGATNNDVLATYLHSVTLDEYISLKKTAEGGRKFSANVFLEL